MSLCICLWIAQSTFAPGYPRASPLRVARGKHASCNLKGCGRVSHQIGGWITLCGFEGKGGYPAVKYLEKFKKVRAVKSRAG